MRVALVHDYLTQYGGAERVLDEFKLAFPDAPVFTSVVDLDRMPVRDLPPPARSVPDDSATIAAE